MLKLYLTLSVLCFLYSCGNDNIEKSNSQPVIGISFGECAGDCVTMYKLEKGEVFPDIEEGHFTNDPMYSDIALDIPDNLVTKFENLVLNTPALLLDNNESTYGTPDAGDWGSIHYFYNDRKWTLDNANENNPIEIQDFVEELQDLIIELGQ